MTIRISNKYQVIFNQIIINYGAFRLGCMMIGGIYFNNDLIAAYLVSSMVLNVVLRLILGNPLIECRILTNEQKWYYLYINSIFMIFLVVIGIFSTNLYGLVGVAIMKILEVFTAFVAYDAKTHTPNRIILTGMLATIINIGSYALHNNNILTIFVEVFIQAIVFFKILNTNIYDYKVVFIVKLNILIIFIKNSYSRHLFLAQNVLPLSLFAFLYGLLELKDDVNISPHILIFFMSVSLVGGLNRVATQLAHQVKIQKYGEIIFIFQFIAFCTASFFMIGHQDIQSILAKILLLLSFFTILFIHNILRFRYVSIVKKPPALSWFNLIEASSVACCYLVNINAFYVAYLYLLSRFLLSVHYFTKRQCDYEGR